MATTARAPLQWLRILVTAFLAAIASMLLILLVLTLINALGIDITPLCPDCPASDLGGIIECLIVCFLVLSIIFGLLYLAFSVVFSAILINVWVGYRRIAHTVIAVLISVPIALLVSWIYDQIF